MKSIQPRQHRTGVLLVISVLVVGVVGVAALLAGGPDEQSPDRRLAAYGYSFALPPGWEQTGGAGSLREVRLTPSGTGGPRAVFVQQNQLDYDSDLDPARPRRELQTQIADAQLAGTFPGRYASFDPEASFAGREVSYYREHPADGSLVDWYVLFQGQVQVSVGCRYTPDVAGQVEQACREVVRTLQIR